MKNNLTLEQINAEKIILQAAVLAAVKAFQTATGLELENLSLHPDRSAAESLPPKFYLTTIAGEDINVQFGANSLPF